MTDVLDLLGTSERDQLRKEAGPAWSAPMLATLTERRFSDPGWLFERKLDGERALAVRRGDSARLLSRNEIDLGDAYPELIEALAGQACTRFVADGEIVAFDGKVTSFARLQRGVTWVTPELVGEFAFTEWTGAGKLRHPRFLGLRRDKKARDVVRERPGADA